MVKMIKEGTMDECGAATSKDVKMCPKPDTEELPDLLAMAASATANLAAAGGEVTKGKNWSCNLPTVTGDCCDMMKDAIAGNKGAAKGFAMKMIKGGTMDACDATTTADMPHCPPPPEGEELPDFLAMAASATANLDAATDVGANPITGATSA